MEKDSALIPIEERSVLFYDDEIKLALVRTGDKEQAYVPVRPMCDFLGVAWSPQLRRINRDPILSEVATSVTVTVTEAGQRGQMLCLPIDFLNGWLFGINATRVKPTVKERLLRYQRECYQVLAQAFTPQSPQGESATMSALVQVREMGLAIVRMAEEQMEFERRLMTTEVRLDQAATVYGDLTKRVKSLEAQLTPGKTVSEAQASQISQAVKAVALALGQKSGRNEFGGVYGELYRRYDITGYKMLPLAKFEACMAWLSEWYQNLTGETF
ncbi:MAG: phage antirepressor N-terminal domain-containing protein [Candidatus Promineifilaceae bacterium]